LDWSNLIFEIDEGIVEIHFCLSLIGFVGGFADWAT
jgi:hypothetical protein